MADLALTDFAVTTRDGRTLHAQRAGDSLGVGGAPTVVFEAGMGFSGSSWGAVFPLVAAQTDAVIYDRSGLGLSPPDAGRRDLDKLTDDLCDVLDHLGEGPFVLVGHSWGGPIVRSAAARVPDRTAGLVLVDPTDEGADLFFSKAQARQEKLMPSIMRAMARTGLLRRIVHKQAAALPEPWATNVREHDGTVAALDEQLAELRSCTADLRRLRAHPLAVPDAPFTVITGAKTTALERGKRQELIAAHQARTDAAPQGRHVMAERSGHYIPLTEPQLIADEIERIIEAHTTTDR